MIIKSHKEEVLKRVAIIELFKIVPAILNNSIMALFAYLFNGYFFPDLKMHYATLFKTSSYVIL